MSENRAQTSVLVTGGAGYIGSHTVLALLKAGYRPVVLDDLSTGRRALVPAGTPLVTGDVGDSDLVGDLLRQHNCRAVLHFAGSIIVPESVQRPLDYYRNNTANSFALLQACQTAGIAAFIFSSTAAVYGETRAERLSEDMSPDPANPYARSKWMTEWALADAARAAPLPHVVLRYFNVAGADSGGRSGQVSPVATHLIKRACQAVLGRLPHIDIFGSDYDTPDGTGVRDYIHVSDLADAHVAALTYLLDGGDSATFNCGYGRGYSVKEVLDVVDKAAGNPVPRRNGPRRPGDVGRLVADVSRIRRTLDWTPRHDDLDSIVETALAWERRLQQDPTLAD